MSKKRGQGGARFGGDHYRAVVSQLSVEGTQYLPYGAVKLLSVWRIPLTFAPARGRGIVAARRIARSARW